MGFSVNNSNLTFRDSSPGQVDALAAGPQGSARWGVFNPASGKLTLLVVGSPGTSWNGFVLDASGRIQTETSPPAAPPPPPPPQGGIPIG